MKVLVLEDDRFIAEQIKINLELDSYEVDIFNDPKELFEGADFESYDIFLFDINLPVQNGYKTLMDVRNYGLDTPTIFITSNSDIESLKKGYESGCNDYLRKPFHFDELKFRIEQLVFKGVGKKIKLSKRYSFDLQHKTLFDGVDPVSLNIHEEELLYLLAKNIPNVISSQQIIEKVWTEKEICQNTLRTAIKKLRTKLVEDFIVNVRSVGYKIEKLS
jgi:DNA-binding response OmpR family regulator